MSEPVEAQIRRRDRLHVVWEGLVLLLVCANLALILFDSLFSLAPINQALAWLLPQLHRLYGERIHANFQYIDLGFVAIFLIDVLAGWLVSLIERRYERWYFYPFVHWYDVLGCIPLAGFRWLRVLRIVALLIRLQRLGLIDMRRWALYGFAGRYYHLLLEELSDRVMVKLFSRMQQEIGSSDDLCRRLIDGVVRPRKQRLLSDVSARLQRMLEQGYQTNKAAIDGYVGTLIHGALAQNGELRALRRLPLGDRLATTLDDTLQDVALRLIQGLVDGLQSEQFQALARRLADEAFEAWLRENEETGFALEELLVDILEVLKQQVLDRRWSRFVGPPPPPAAP